MLDLTHLSTFHTTCIQRWAQSNNACLPAGDWALIEANHHSNYALWQAEDEARRDDLGHAWVYQAKRKIDKLNQARNNQMEAIDSWLYDLLTPPAATIACPAHSETPGMMIDRLSILSLKHFYMLLQTTRQEVEDAHRTACQQKCLILEAQRALLLKCLLTLIEEVQQAKRTFLLYKQLKMYNDPCLNPALYGHQR